MAWDIVSPNTGSSLNTQAPGAKRQLWDKGCEVAEQTMDFFMEMEGKGKDSLIQTKTDTSKGQGQKITFTNKSGFYDEGKQGDELFEASDDFEEILINSYDLEVDYLRHAVRMTERAEEYMGLRGELKAGIPVELGKWLGRTKSHRLFMMFREKINSENTVYAGGKTKATLLSADTISYDEILQLGTRLKTFGGSPARVGYKGKNPIHSYCVVATNEALSTLKLDADYRSLLSNAGQRGNANYIFDGGYVDIDGHVIKEYNPIDHDGEGAIGSPMNPKALLGVAMDATSVATFEVLGGGNATAAAKTKKKYFKDFEGYAYQFNPGDVLSVASTEKYFLVINPNNAATDPGKVGMYAYTTGNNGNKITITKALGTSASKNGTIGDVTYDTGVWSGYHTEVHPIGAYIIPCNAKGVPIGYTHMMGRRAAYRGYGKHRNQRAVQTHEGGFVRDVFICSVFGQKLVQDRLGRHIGAMTLVHAMDYPQFNLPTVTS